MKFEDDIFFQINHDKSLERLKQLIHKQVVLEMKNRGNILFVSGKLLDVFHNMIYLREYDLSQNNDLSFDDLDEDIKISNIIGIEEMGMKKDFNNRYLNQMCEITNIYGKTIEGVVTGYDGLNILMDCYENNQLLSTSYPYGLVKNICMLK